MLHQLGTLLQEEYSKLQEQMSKMKEDHEKVIREELLKMERELQEEQVEADIYYCWQSSPGPKLKCLMTTLTL